ncbi:MAG: TrkH family potassium uptake protein [Bacteroidetes bacterium]|jgi:trk system potassium uptake protein TrkH|nr:TrkH family potassium uptake protein [Bacteroidota bacterium]
MRLEVIFKILGVVILFNAAFLFTATVISYYHQESSLIPLMFTTLICIIFGLFPMVYSGKYKSLSFAEGITVVVSGWVITCVIGMLPYLMWGGEFNLIDAWFESVSGFTTTGSTILNDIEALPKSLLFWRSATHWIGGVGIIVFVLLILPHARNARITLLNTEMSELSKSNFHYKARTTIQILIVVYVGLTLMETLLLRWAGMSWFEGINHAFATIATGGFSTKNSSIAYFENVWIEIIIMIFMLLSGIHFGLIFGTITGSRYNIFRSKVVKSYVLIMFLGIALVAFKLYINDYFTWSESLRYASFQVISIGTTTGFATVDTAFWPVFTQMVIMYFTIQCAMTGSTSGGLKFDRVYLFIKSVRKQVKLIKHPAGVFAIKMENRTISDSLERQTMLFIVLYIFTFFITTLLLSAMDIDLKTAFSASIATLGNVGPGFGNVSSLGNFDGLPDLAKFILSLNMLLGRLEIYSVIALFTIRN